MQRSTCLCVIHNLPGSSMPLIPESTTVPFDCPSESRISKPLIPEHNTVPSDFPSESRVIRSLPLAAAAAGKGGEPRQLNLQESSGAVHCNTSSTAPSAHLQPLLRQVALSPPTAPLMALVTPASARSDGPFQLLNTAIILAACSQEQATIDITNFFRQRRSTRFSSAGQQWFSSAAKKQFSSAAKLQFSSAK